MSGGPAWAAEPPHPEDDQIREKLATVAEDVDEIKALGEDITTAYADRIASLEAQLAEVVELAKSQGIQP